MSPYFLFKLINTLVCLNSYQIPLFRNMTDLLYLIMITEYFFEKCYRKQNKVLICQF